MEEYKKILILLPSEKKKGGQPVYWKSLRPYLKGAIDYQKRGRRSEGYLSRILMPFIMVYDYILFAMKISKYSLIHINSTFNLTGILRDSIFIIIAGIRKKKILIFYHGWHGSGERLMEYSIIRRLYRSIFFKSHIIGVLSRRAKDRLKEWGYRGDICLERTFIDDSLASSINENDLKRRFETRKDTVNLLFMSRIEKTKGICEAIEAFHILKERGENIRLFIAGEGSYLKDIRDKSSGIEILGYIRDEKKIKVLKESDIFILPTDYGEGIPIALLEAMTFGLPVITRNMGGIPDFFLNEKMGYITDSRSPEVFADLILKLIENKDEFKNIAFYNFRYARKYFLASDAGKRIFSMHERLL